MPNAVLLRLAVAFFFLLQPLISTADAKQQIESRFHKKLFFIRGFYLDDQLIYDAQGNVQGQPKAGPWSLAAVKIDKVNVRSDEFRLQGRRATAVYDSKQKKFKYLILDGTKVNIIVRTPPDALSDSAVDSFANQIFLVQLTPQDVPEAWRSFFMGRVTSAPKDLPPKTPIPGLESDGQPVFRPNPSAGITPPHAINAQDPTYAEVAREAKVEGTCVFNVIVSKQGLPEHIEVAKPLGVGLDDASIEAIRGWRFRPAVMNDQPVAVLVSVEVNFRLQ
jgi:TonB family protein